MASKTGQRGARLLSPLAALTGERKRDHPDNQGAGFLRLLRDDRRGTRGRPSAQAGTKDDQLRSRAGLDDLSRAFTSGGLADGRIATRAQTRGGLAAKLDFVRG